MWENGEGKQIKTIQGRDFYFRGDGRMVFTSEYLLARGTCCNSICTNCPYEHRQKQEHDLSRSRIAIFSFVPSWTETLIAAQANVLGRTRFCIHPKDHVKHVDALGGTKNFSTEFDVKLQNIKARHPGMSFFALLDREENPRAFFEDLKNRGVTPIVTHVGSLPDVPKELGMLSNFMREKGETEVAQTLENYRTRFELVLTQRERISPEKILKRAFLELPESAELSSVLKAEKIAYLIWKNPWMSVSQQTLIASVLEFVLARPNGSASEFLYSPGADRYPKLEAIPAAVLPVYSSEPYPFLREVKSLPKGLFVDGELYSWFGIRLLRFLEDLLVESR